jgi:hypothetical protein
MGLVVMVWNDRDGNSIMEWYEMIGMGVLNMVWNDRNHCSNGTSVVHLTLDGVNGK